MSYAARISKRCKERFLHQSTEGLWALRCHNIELGGISALRKTYEIMRKCPDNHSVFYTLAGEGRLDLPERKALTPGTVCLLPAGLDHAYGTGSTWDVFWFHLDAAAPWNALMPETAVLIHALWAERLKILMEEFLRESLQRNRAGHRVLLEGYARLMALFLERELRFSEHSGHSEQRRRLEHLWHLVTEEPGRDWSIGALARAGNFSRSSLELAAHRIYGCGAMEMVRRLRMERAAGLILQRRSKLADIAASVGYESAFSFSHAFKRVMGVTPRDYGRERNNG